MCSRRNNNARHAVTQLINTAHEAFEQRVTAQQGTHVAHALPCANPGAQTQNICGGKNLRVGHQTLSVAGAGTAQAEETHAHDGDHQVHHCRALGGANDQPAGQCGQCRGHQGGNRSHDDRAGCGANADAGQFLQGAQACEQAGRLGFLDLGSCGGARRGGAFSLVLCLVLEQVRGGLRGNRNAGGVRLGGPCVALGGLHGMNEGVAASGEFLLVGHNQHGCAQFRQAVQGAGHQVRRIGVQVRGRFIHQDGQHGLLTAGTVDSLGTSQGACHGEAACLTCAEGAGLKGGELLHAQLSQRANQQSRLGIGGGQLLGVHRFTEQSGCALTLRLGGAECIESHFGLHGRCGEDRRLRNDQGGAQTGHATGQVHGLLRAGGHQTLTHGTGEHVQQGGLTATGLTHHTNDRAAFTLGSFSLAGGNATVQVQRQVSQHGRTRRVADRQVLNSDHGRLSLLCCRTLCSRVRSGGGQGRVNNLLGATQGGNAVLRLVVGGTHITQRLVAFGSQQQHENCGVQAQGAVDQAHTNQHSNQRHRNGGDELQRERRHEGAAQGLHGAFTVALAESVHGAGLCTFAAQTDNDGQAAHELQNMVGEAVQFSLRFCGFVAGVLTD